MTIISRIKRMFGKTIPAPDRSSNRSTYAKYMYDIDDRTDEERELAILSEPGWLGDIARKHHG